MKKISGAKIALILIIFQLVGITGSSILIVKKAFADPVINLITGNWVDTFLDNNPVNSNHDGVASSSGLSISAGDVKLSSWLDEKAYSIAIDSQRNIIIAGYQNNAIGNQDMLVRKYNSGGVEQ